MHNELILFSELHIHVYIVQMFLFTIHNNVYIKKYAKFNGVQLSLRDCKLYCAILKINYISIS